MAGERLWGRNFLLLCGVNFLLYCSFYIYLPILPLYIVEELGGREDQVGVLIGIFTITALAIRPWAEVLAVKSGRKSLLVLALLLFSVVIGAYMIAISIAAMLFIRLLHGGAYGLATTIAATAVADDVPKSRRGEGIGYFVTIAMIATAVGPLLGPPIVGKWSYTMLFTVSLCISLSAWMLANFVKLDRHKAKPSPAARIQWRTMYEPRVLGISLAMFFLALGFGGVLSFVWLYSLRLNVANIGAFFFVLFSAALVISRPVSGRLYDKFGANIVIFPGFILFFAGMLLLGATDDPVWFLMASFLIGTGYGSLGPSLQALSIDSVGADRRAAAMATFLSAIDLGIGIGAMLLGVVIQFFGYEMMFFAICLLIVIAGCVYYRVQSTARGAKTRLRS